MKNFINWLSWFDKHGWFNDWWEMDTWERSRVERIAYRAYKRGYKEGSNG